MLSKHLVSSLNSGIGLGAKGALPEIKASCDCPSRSPSRRCCVPDRPSRAPPAVCPLGSSSVSPPYAAYVFNDSGQGQTWPAETGSLRHIFQLLRSQFIISLALASPRVRDVLSFRTSLKPPATRKINSAYSCLIAPNSHNSICEKQSCLVICSHSIFFPAPSTDLVVIWVLTKCC